MAGVWRWMPGASRGQARGVAVFGGPGLGSDPDRLADVLGRCERLRRWAGAHGITLTDRPEDLPRLDHAIDQWGDDPRVTGVLAIEAGLFLGTVLAGYVPGARWTVRPNGHPVIRVASGRELDVVALAAEGVSGGRSRLAVSYAETADGRRW